MGEERRLCGGGGRRGPAGAGVGTRLLTHSFPSAHTGTAAQKPVPTAEIERQGPQSALAGETTEGRVLGGVRRRKGVGNDGGGR